MRKQYIAILNKFFHKNLTATRMQNRLSQVKMADKLIMDTRSYVNLDHGKSGCSALTLALFLIYLCDDAPGFLNELRKQLEDTDNYDA